MPTVGIVCEYNPFHKGHLYMLEELRRRFGAQTTVVCAMSGDFVQRGEAAVYDKFTRAEAACRAGADLVLELPLPWCLSSAEGFAEGAVALLAAIGCEVLAFGSESGELAALERLAAFALDPMAQARVHGLMEGDASLSYARARQQAAEESLGAEAALLLKPNDILAVEYLKAIRKRGNLLTPLAIRRMGSGHDSMDGGVCCSAMELRHRMGGGEDVTAYIPPEALAVYRGKTARNQARLEIALLSRLYALSATAFEKLPDAGGGAGQYLYKAVQKGGGPEQIAREASTKRYTVARMRRMLLPSSGYSTHSMRRMLLCAALGVCAEDARGTPPYLRVLAADERGRALLRERKDEASVPPLTKPAAVRKLSPAAVRSFTLGANAHDLYQLACTESADIQPGADWRERPVIV